MIRTFHSKPQVTVSINNIMSKCVGSCDFEWLETATPTVSNINTTNLAAIVITGTGFDTNAQNNKVKIGDVACSISSATSIELICAAGSNSIGTYTFSVNVLGKGLATISSNPSVTFQLTASTLYPTSSGTGGGALLNITGTGFNSNCSVQIDGTNCLVVFVNYSMITCVVPSNVSFCLSII